LCLSPGWYVQWCERLWKVLSQHLYWQETCLFDYHSLASVYRAMEMFCWFHSQAILLVCLANALRGLGKYTFHGPSPFRVTEVALNSSQLWANWIDVFTGNPHFTIILRRLVWLLTELVKTCNTQLPFYLKHFSVFLGFAFSNFWFFGPFLLSSKRRQAAMWWLL
jgi:hypothetical protein